MSATAELMWHPHSNADGYRLYQDDVFIAELTDASTDQYSYEMPNADVGESFVFAIEAYNKHGTGPRVGITATVEEAAP